MIGDLIKIRPEDLPNRKQRRRREPMYKRSTVRLVAAIVLVGSLIVFLGGKAYLKPFEERALTFNLADAKRLEQSSILYDRTGKELGRVSKENRVIIPFSEMPMHLVDALISTEDSRFWKHTGIDYVGIIRALKDNLLSGKIKQGASTLTQQIVKNTWGMTEVSKERKILEMFLARRLEQEYTKPELLEMYLNRIPFGKGFHGIESAAQGYFNKSAQYLTKSEAATLVGIIKAPTSYSPLNNLKLAQRERNETFDRMVLGGKMDAQEAAKLSAEPIVLNPSAIGHASGYVAGEVEDEVEQILAGLGMVGITGKGFRIHTTVDPAMQKAAEDSLRKNLNAIEARSDYPADREKYAQYALKLAEFDKSKRPAKECPVPGYLQGAVMAIESNSGAVLAMVGGRDFTQSQFNRSKHSRRPLGTAFVPFVYTSAFEGKTYPGSRVVDQRMDNTRVMLGATTGTLGEWGCETLEGSHDENTSIRRALIQGKNNSVARLGLDLGLDRIQEFANRAGFADVPADPPTLLGRAETSVKEVCQAYTIFPNQGIRVTDSYFVTKIEASDGRVLFDRGSTLSIHKVCDSAAAWMTHHCLEEVMEIGTASNARELGLKPIPVAGKTGTHLNSTDLWFAGYTSRVTCAVWIGQDRKDRIYPDAFSRHTALPVWVDIINASTERFEPTAFIAPKTVSTVELCALSGQLATEACLEKGQDPDSPDRIKLFKCSYFEYIRPEVKIEKICALHTGDPAAMEEIAARSHLDVSAEVAATTIPVGVNSELAVADAKPVVVKARTVLGEDPYKSYSGLSRENPDGSKLATVIKTVISDPFAAPAIPSAPVPGRANSGTGVNASPGKAGVD